MGYHGGMSTDQIAAEITGTCDGCGDDAESLTPVEDSDTDVGYRATEYLCPTCVQRLG